MKKLTILSLASVFSAAAFISCNSDYTPAENTSSNVVVYSFSLSKDDSVLAHLDTVFFSINLDEARIFNADSLPYGTRTDKLVPVIKMLETATRANLTVKRADGTDTVYNYLTNSTDTIDFSNGPVLLDITSPSGIVSRTYSIEVNVHKLKSDSLVWSHAASRSLPSSLATLTAQRTVRTSAGVYCLTTDGSQLSMAFAEHPDAEIWDKYTPSLPADADINTLSATDDALFVLADGALHSSTDGGLTWSDTGARWHHIYGGYGTTLTGCAKASDGTFELAYYPATAGVAQAVPADMPVSGTSLPVSFTFPMADAPQTVIAGGVMANGKLSPDTWAFDGSNWAKLSEVALPKGLKDMCLVPFSTFIVNVAFVAVEYPVLLAYGGTDGKDINKTVYISNDYGMTWKEGGESIQLPEAVTPFSGAQAFVFTSVLQSRSASSWRPMTTAYRIPGSRATMPVTEWDCPYIYTFGGTDGEGKLCNTVWRATLNRLTFKPVI